MRRLLVLLAFLLVAPLAHADGDPASDFLYTRHVFVPFDIKGGAAQAAQLDATVEGATKAGFTIRVAVIGSAYDLGSVPSLWRKPQLYARFLGEELAFIYKQRLLIVMPDGFGFFWKGHPTTQEYAVLTKIRTGAGGPALLTAARTAVEQLAAADGVKIAAAKAPKSTTSRDRAIIAIAAALAIALSLLARVLLRRRRGERG
jgi:hypothetical protein